MSSPILPDAQRPKVELKIETPKNEADKKENSLTSLAQTRLPDIAEQKELKVKEATVLNPNILWATKFIKMTAPEHMPLFEELPPFYQYLYGQLVKIRQSEIERQVRPPHSLIPSNIKIALEKLKILKEHAEINPEIEDFLKNCSGTWKVTCLPMLGTYVQPGHENNLMILKNLIQWLERFKDPIMIYCRLTLCIESSEKSSNLQYLQAQARMSLNPGNEEQWTLVCKDQEASRNWFYMLNSDVPKAILRSSLSQQTKSSLMKSQLMRNYTYEARFNENQELVLNYTAPFVEFQKNGSYQIIILKFIPALNSILNDEALAKAVLAFSKKFPGNEETLLRMTEKDPKISKEILTILSSTPETVPDIMKLLKKSVGLEGFKLEMFLNLVKHPMFTRDFVEGCLKFSELYPEHLSTLLSLFKIRLDLDQKIKKTKDELNVLEHDLQFLLASSRKGKNTVVNEMQGKAKKLRNELKRLNNSWIVKALPDGQDVFKQLLCFSKTDPQLIHLLDAISIVLKRDDNQNTVFNLLYMHQKDPEFEGRLVNEARNLLPAQQSYFLANMFTLKNLHEQTADDVLALANKNPDAFKTFCFMGGLFKTPQTFVSEIALDWLEGAKWSPRAVSALCDYTLYMGNKNGNPPNAGETELYSQLFLSAVQDTPSEFLWCLKPLLGSSMASIKFINWLLVRTREDFFYPVKIKSSKSSNEFAHEKLDYSLKSSSFYKLLKNQKGLTELQIQQFSYLIGFDQEFLAMKLLRFYQENPALAQKLLELAVEGRNGQLAAKVLDFCMAHPDDKMVLVLKAWVQNDNQKSLQNLFKLRKLAQTKSDEQILHKKVMEMLIQGIEPSKELKMLVDLAVTGHIHLLQEYFQIKDKKEPLTNKQAVFLNAIREGSIPLLQKMQSLPDDFWHALSQTPSLMVAELLIEIQRQENDPSHSLTKFALDLINHHSQEDAVKYLSQLLFIYSDFATRQPYSLEKLKEGSEKKMGALRQTLESFYQSYKATLMDGDEGKIARSIFLPSVLSQALLAGDGMINIPLIQELKKHLIDTSPSATSFEQHLVWVMDSIESNKGLQEAILSAELSDNPKDQGHLLTRSILGLPHDFPLTLLHARQALLTTLLTHIRQGKVGSCVGSSRANEMKTDLEHCARLFSTMLKKQYLESMIYHRNDTFHFLTNLNTQDLNKKVIFRKNGDLLNVQSSSAKLWDIPGFARMGAYLGIESSRQMEWLQNTLSVNSDDFDRILSSEEYECSLNKMIHLLVIEAKKLNPALNAVTADLEYGARLAFLSVTENPLNRALEAVLIGLDFPARQNIRNSITTALKQIHELKIFISPDGRLLDVGDTKGLIGRSPPFKAFFATLDISSQDQINEILQKTLVRIKTEAKEKHSPLKDITLRNFLNELLKTSRGEGIPDKGDPDPIRSFLKKLGVSNESILGKMTLEYSNKKSTEQLNPLIALFYPGQKTTPDFLELLEWRLADDKNLFDKFLKEVKKEIQERFEVVYNHDRPEKPGSSHGGKILIDLKNFAPGNEKGISTQEEFSDLCSDIITCSVERLKQRLNAEQISGPAVDPELEKFKKASVAYTKGTLYQECLLRKFVKNYEAIGKEPYRHLGNFFQLPWSLTTGANPLFAWGVATQSDEKKQYKDQFYPENAFEAAKKLLSAGMLHGAKDRPDILIGGSIPGHSISFMFGHDSLQPVWKSSDPIKWLNENVLKPGKEVAESKIKNEEFIKKLLDDCMTYLEENEKLSFREATQNIPVDLTYSQFRKKIIDAIASLKGSYRNLSKIECKVDTRMMELLPSEAKAKLSQLHFANTNWLDEKLLQDIHFCFVFNPGTNAIEMWKINKDGTKLSKTPQDMWLNGDDWTIFFTG